MENEEAVSLIREIIKKCSNNYTTRWQESLLLHVLTTEDIYSLKKCMESAVTIHNVKFIEMNKELNCK
jgi:hypothetical protein